MNCPTCGDKRKRLYISYLVGSDMQYKGYPVKTYGLMHCHNENCNNIVLYHEIRRKLGNPPVLNVKQRTGPGTIIADLPAPNYLINSSRAHPAPVEYMKRRGFDLDELAEDYGVRTCERIPGVEHLGQMILFPSYDGDKITFWQARLSYDPQDRRPKYYFAKGTRKSDVLYGRYNALTSPVVVITEGVLDAIRVGKGGVAVFGKYPSVAQTRIMAHVFKRKLGILMLDPDAEKEAVKWYEKYKGDALFGKGLYLCRLTDRDPAEHTREELWDKLMESVKCGS